MSIECPACRQPNPDDATFCGECGSALKVEVTCATCGRANPPGLTFCRGCGARLSMLPAVAIVEARTAIPTSVAAGRYRLERLLGEGSKKRVYLAQDTRLDRAVAVALFKSDGLDREGQLRIQREAHALARLGDHPHIVTLYDIGEEAGQSYFVSQYLAGGTVQEWLQRSPQQRLSLAEALRVMEQLCQALMHAHQHDILHRDLKPSNVWLTSDGTIKLGDFGLAASLEHSRLTMEGILVGTAAYLPPEHLQGGKLTAHSDLYSLGAICYELVTGRPPFVGDTLVSLIAQHLNSPPVAPVQYNPTLPPALNILILQLLAKQPAERPASAAAVRATLQSLATAPTTRSTVVTPALDRLARNVFVGREREMDTLRASLEETLTGQGRVAVLLGEPGIGKTRLATELTSYAQVRGLRILLGRCPDSEGVPPYWPWVQIVRTYVSECEVPQLRKELGVGAADLAQVIPAIRERLPDLVPSPHLEAEQERFRFFDSLTTFLKNITRRQPLLLLLDDLQWADASSLLFLQFLVRELTDTKLFLVITCRESEATQQPLLTQTLVTLARVVGSQTFRLRGLTDGDVARFIELTTGHATTPEVSTAVFQRTEGHPFFLTEIVRLLATEQDTTVLNPLQPVLPVLPATVRSVIEQRLVTVSDECRQLLTKAAVVGREFRLPVLEALQEERQTSDHTVLTLLDEALAAQLLIPVPQQVGHYTFTHALIQETLYAALPTPQRLQLHRTIGETLEMLAGVHREPYVAELAHHFFQATISGAAHKALAYAQQAAEQATALLAYEDAVQHYQRVLEVQTLLPPNEEQRTTLLLALAQAWRQAGNRTQASEVFQQAITNAKQLLKTSQHPSAAELLGHATLGYSSSVLLDQTDHYGPLAHTLVNPLEDALSALGAEDSALRVRVLCRLVVALSSTPDMAERRTLLLNNAIAMARRLGDEHALAEALQTQWVVLREPDTLTARLQGSEELLRLAETLGSKELLVQTRMRRLFDLLEAGAIDAFDQEMALYAQSAAELRQPFYLRLYTAWRAMRAGIEGHFAEAEQLSQQLYVLGLREQEPYAEHLFVMQQCVFTYGRRPDGIVSMLERHMAKHPQITGWLGMVALVHAEAGRTSEAQRELASFVDQHFANLPYDSAWISAMATLAEVSYLLCDQRAATIVFPLLLPYTGHGVRAGLACGYIGAADYYLGVLATTLERWEEAEIYFHQALQFETRMRARPWLARTQYSYASMLLIRDHPDDQEQAVTLLDQALETAQELGMDGLEDKVKSQRAKIKSRPIVVSSQYSVVSREEKSSVQSLAPKQAEASVPTQSSTLSPQHSIFRHDGEYWTIKFADAECRLKDSRGLHYLSQLLRHPHREFSAFDLVNLGMTASDTARPQRVADLLTTASVTTGGDAGEMLDPQAKAAYQQRLKELREELEEAREFNDVGRVEKLEEESEFLIQELSRAVGLGGRRRKAGAAAERARLNVTVTLKNTIARITKHHKPLGQHLTQTIKTGTFCSYAPDPALTVQWKVE